MLLAHADFPVHTGKQLPYFPYCKTVLSTMEQLTLTSGPQCLAQLPTWGFELCPSLAQLVSFSSYAALPTAPQARQAIPTSGPLHVLCL